MQYYYTNEAGIKTGPVAKEDLAKALFDKEINEGSMVFISEYNKEFILSSVPDYKSIEKLYDSMNLVKWRRNLGVFALILISVFAFFIYSAQKKKAEVEKYKRETEELMRSLEERRERILNEF